MANEDTARPMTEHTVACLTNSPDSSDPLRCRCHGRFLPQKGRSLMEGDMWSAGICCRFDRHCDVQVTERPVEELQWRFSGLTLHTVPSERLFHPGICADHD